MKVKSLKFHHKLPHSSTSCLDLWLWLFARLRRVLKVVSIAIVWVCEERKTASEIFTFLFAICFFFCNKHFWHRTTQTYKNEKKEQEKRNWGDPGEGVWVEQFSSVVHGHVEPLEPIRGQKKLYIIIDIKAAIILTVRSLLCPLQEAQTQTCAWLHSSSVCTVYETFLRYFSLPSTSSPFKFSKHPFTLFTVCFGFLVRFAFLIWTDMLADSHTFTELNIYGSTFKTWWSVLYVFFGSNAAHFCRRATAFPSDHPCLQKLAHNYSGCHCSTAS